MKKLIHGYLSYSGYRIVNNKIVNSNDKIITPNELIKELILVFCYSKKELKWYLKSWAKNKGQNFNFNKWWAPLPKFIPLNDYWIDSSFSPNLRMVERYGHNITTGSLDYTNITNITTGSLDYRNITSITTGSPNYVITSGSAHNTTVNIDYNFAHNTTTTANENITYSTL